MRNGFVSGQKCFAALGLAFMVGCSSTPETAKPKTLADIDKPLPVKELGRFGTAAADSYVFQPAVVGKAIFVAGANGDVQRYEDGREIWRIGLDQRLSGGVAANDQMLVVGGLKGNVIALSPMDGKLLWQSAVGAEIAAPAALLDDMVVVRTGDNRLLGLDRQSGQRKWTYQRTVPPLSVRVVSAPVVADRLVFTGFPGGKLVAVNTQTGQAVWEGTVALPKGSTELERISDVVAAPIIGAKEVCAAAHQGRLACFDLNNGTLLWARDVSVSNAIVMDNKAVYVADDQGIVQAFDRTTGGTLWKQEKLINRRLSGPMISRGYLVLTDDQGMLHVMDREDGAFRGRFNLQAGRVESELRSVESNLIFQTDKGLLMTMQVDQ